jgi:hypothetical protein
VVTDRSGRDNPGSARPRIVLWVIGILVAIVALLVVSGLGAKGIDRLTGEGPPLSYVTEERGGCSSIAYLPASRVPGTRRQLPPRDWRAFDRQPAAKFVGSDVIRVSVEGGSARELTITGVRFSAEKRHRPGGAVFIGPCNGGFEGRGFEADIEAGPPRLTVSSANGEGRFSAFGLGGFTNRPVTFPWTVSLERRPLNFFLVATAHHCYCVWTARIPWVSGDDHGVIKVDNGGRGYTVVGIEGLSSFAPLNGKWHKYRVGRAQN